MKATPRQVREIMRRIYYHQEKLQEALNDAHNKDIIAYPDGTFKDNAPCASFWETGKRIDATTEKALAETMRKEIQRTIK